MTTDQIKRLIDDSPGSDILDELADRIADRLRSPEKLTLSITEAAERLGLCQNTIRELIHTGKLPCLQFNGRYLIPVPALMKLLENPPKGEQNG